MVSKVLDEQRLATIRRGCAETIREMVARDPQSAGNRGSHRYTFGTAPAHFGHQHEWATLIDPPRTLAVLSAIFGSDDFLQTASASGGDFVLPGCCEYQHLHACAAAPLATSLPTRGIHSARQRHSDAKPGAQLTQIKSLRAAFQ